MTPAAVQYPKIPKNLLHRRASKEALRRVIIIISLNLSGKRMN
jgi:hypothetical protein